MDSNEEIEDSSDELEEVVANKKRKTHIDVDVETFRKQDNMKALTTVGNGIEVCKVFFKTRSELFNRWISTIEGLEERCPQQPVP